MDRHARHRRPVDPRRARQGQSCLTSGLNLAPIGRDQSGHRGVFFIERDGKRLAEMTYSVAGKTRLIIDHTDVSDELRGTGAGKRLVEAAVQWAREEKKVILPLCPFARSVFEKTPAYQDVLLR